MRGHTKGETSSPLGSQAFEMLSHLGERSLQLVESVECQTPVPTGIATGCQASLGSGAMAWTGARVSS